ncbi:MAG: DNA topoisomerase [Conexivisphaerales archaeon]
MKTLVIAEKPSVARDIAKALGVNELKQNYYENSTYVISWAAGHLFNLAYPSDYVNGFKWSLDSVPFFPKKFEYKVINKQFDVLKKLIQRKDIDTIVNACDAGREGELIFREIIEHCNPKGKTLKRLWLSSMTKEEIIREFQQLKDLKQFDGLAFSAYARQWADWIVGINATIAVTSVSKNLRSIGRVQTPTLYFIVQREREIKSFKPETYYTVTGLFHNNFDYTGVYKNKFKTKKEAEYFLKALKTIKTGVVSDIKDSVVVITPPPLYDLTELQRDANKIFGFSAQKTLDIAQKLYEHYKAITYPRTDSKYLPLSLKNKVPDLLSKLSSRYQYKTVLRTEIFDDKKVTDHYAIIPTGVIPNLSGDEEKVFDLICKRFIATQMPNAEEQHLSFLTLLDKFPFETSINRLLVSGWKEVYGLNKEQRAFLRDNSDVVRLKIDEKHTQPPQRFTDATLLSAMEKVSQVIDESDLKKIIKDKGIGTPATRSQIIEKLIHVGYIRREKRTLIPTDKGMDTIKMLENMMLDTLLSPKLTAEWEFKLEMVDTKKKMDEFIGGIKEMTNSIIQKVRRYHEQTREIKSH